MKKIYTMKFLAGIGAAVLAAVAFWMTVALLIPTYRAPEMEGQLYAIRHQELRDNNPLYTNLLLTSVKRNGGYLVLGTSETNARPRGNYYDFLNADTALRCGFSVIAGAGRTPCTYFPLIQANENVRGLKVIFFLNPSYGCGKLASSNADYFGRYVSFARYRKANHPINQDVDKILKANLKNYTWVDQVADYMADGTDRVRRKYTQDLVFRLNPDRFLKGLVWLDRSKANLSAACVPPDSSRYNYEFNVSASFDVHSYTLWPHPEET